MVSGQTSAYYGAGLTAVLPQVIIAPGGSDFLAIDANFAATGIAPGVSQTISGLTVGSSYKVSFSYALTQWSGYTGSPDSSNWTAILGGPSASAPTVTIITTQTSTGWATATFYYVASRTAEVLQLLAANGSGVPPLALLTNVSRTNAPEPMSIAVVVTGILGLIGVARRRRARSRAIA